MIRLFNKITTVTKRYILKRFFKKKSGKAVTANTTASATSRTMSVSLYQKMSATEREQLVIEFIGAAGPHGNLDTVKKCINKGVDVEAQESNSWNALRIAGFWNHLHIVKYLFEQCHANVEAKNNNGWTALHMASQEGHLSVVQYLVQECRVDVTMKSNVGGTALHYASFKGHLDIVRYLIQECRVDVTMKNNEGSTVLHWASFKGHLDIVRYLIQECHADVTMKNNEGYTALHYASNEGHLDIVRYLVRECYADVAMKNNEGYTALHYASSEGHLDIVRYLVRDCHADAAIKNNDGKTACELAMSHGNELKMSLVAHYLQQTQRNNEFVALSALVSEQQDIILQLKRDVDNLMRAHPLPNSCTPSDSGLFAECYDKNKDDIRNRTSDIEY